MSQKILLTGEPGVGKTTLFQKVITALGPDCAGFYAREIRENEERAGFEIVTLNLPVGNGPMAHVNFPKDHHVAQYGVDLTHLEKVTEAARPLLHSDKILIIDEIGQMQSYSQKFREFIEEALTSDVRLIATIKQAAFPWTDSIKENFQIPIETVTLENRDSLPQKILSIFQS